MFEIILLILVVMLIGAVGALFVFIKNNSQQQNPRIDEKIHAIQSHLNQQLTNFQNTLDKRLDTTTNRLDTRLDTSTKHMQDTVHKQLSESTKLIKNITEEITKVQEGNTQVLGVAEQLRNFEKILTNQKQRGNLGELGLELVLQNILPPETYAMQYQFKNGEIVDAIIQTHEGIIPIDSKFPLPNYQRMIDESDKDKKEALMKTFKNDVKARIDETAKYIRPEEGTLSFAFMFIPAEGVYYDLFINSIGAGVDSRNLLEYSYKDKNVVIVSPTTFAAYLQSVLYGFKAFQIEKNAQEIRKRVIDLEKHILKYDEYVEKMGNSLKTTVNHYNNSYNELRKVDRDVKKITANVESETIQPTPIEPPQQHEKDEV